MNPAKVSLGTTIFSAAFLMLLGVLHILEPEFDPTWRMISEYAIGPYGILMVIAFFCWGASVLSLLIALWSSLRGAVRHVVRVWFLVIVAALFGAGIFVTMPITEPAVTFAHRMHQVCGVLVIFTFPMASSLMIRSLLLNESWKPLQDKLALVKWLPWLGLLGFFGVLIATRLLHPEVVRAGPEKPIGVPNRVLVVMYHAWLQMMAIYVRKK